MDINAQNPENSNNASSTLIRADGRHVDELRPVTIQRGWTQNPEGSVLIQCGNTRVLCTASFTPSVPRWRKDSGKGWVTAEYAMIPRATSERTDRESVRGKVGGRTHEISRLIGRVLRGIVDMEALGENMIQIDCDVLQADGGTRTTSITGAYIALADAIAWAKDQGHIPAHKKVLTDQVSAVSVGVIDGTPMLDLPYVEDSRAQTDMNVAMTGSGNFIEIQGTAEGAPYSRETLNILLDLAQKGNEELQSFQRQALGEVSYQG
ncbi:ribonuclease PH [Alloscardovia criceti]|uniref:ribonuclease PH n=1 Tax=Alloscardovia criceti TaxID=356828 RepID=UPI000373325C|nr:ribonuclease PH [Alloscardovia criceti]